MKIPCPWKMFEWSVFQRNAERCITTEKVDFIIQDTGFKGYV